MQYDLIIIGGGPAGLSAGIYAARKKLKVLLLAEEIGGQVMEASVIDNYLGLPEISGPDLVRKFVAHLKKYGEDCEIKEGESVESIIGDGVFTVKTKKNEYETRAVLVTSGRQPRRLSVPGAREFEGKGIVYCATCDAPLFGGKNVAVVGAGNSALDAALQLTKYSAKIYVLNRSESLIKADTVYVERVKENKLIEVLNNVEVREVKGGKFVNGLIYLDKVSGEEKKIDVEGVFVEIGSIPVIDYINVKMEYNSLNEIIIDSKTNMSSHRGIFAAGDVSDTPYKQIIVAAGEGAKAAMSIFKYLMENK